MQRKPNLSDIFLKHEWDATEKNKSENEPHSWEAKLQLPKTLKNLEDKTRRFGNTE